MNILKLSKMLLSERNKQFISVDNRTFKKWKYLLLLCIFLNRNYITCVIRRKKYKKLKNFIVIGLKDYGYVRRRTSGYAKDYIKNSQKRNKPPICIYCNQKLTMKNATADHIIPISKKGNNCKVNLVVCCKRCNGERGNMDFNKYMKIKRTDYDDNWFI